MRNQIIEAQMARTLPCPPVAEGQQTAQLSPACARQRMGHDVGGCIGKDKARARRQAEPFRPLTHQGTQRRIRLCRRTRIALIFARARSDAPPHRLRHPVLAQVTQGDAPQGTPEFQSLFAVGLALFLLTLALNVLANSIIRRYKEAY